MKFKQKPVIVDAWPFPWEDVDDPKVHIFDKGGDSWVAEIDVRDGVVLAKIGDWIVRGADGAFFPCAPDAFKATYDPVEK